jgi:hypothetical protein
MSRMACRGALVLCTVVGLATIVRAETRPAEPAATASFALIIGVTKSVDLDQEPLRYADDDAARYLDLFRSLGARTYILAHLDENTARLHPQAAAEALEPVHDTYAKTVAALRTDIRTAHERGLRSAFYFIYAGHGQIRGNGGYLALADARLGEQEIRETIEQLDASQTHVIVDACHADFLALGRGPGGRRRSATGFARSAGLAGNERVGFFLAASATGQIHEWEGFQAGVFSHEVRSGLYGAADADGDGWVSYRELAAFVMRANAGIVNERYRPNVLARPPRTTENLVDLHPALTRRLQLDGTEPAAHHVVEDEHGVRLLDFHNARGRRLTILRPAASGRLFVRRTSDKMEFVLPAVPGPLAFASLVGEKSTTAERGPINLAFDALFAMPFDEKAVEQVDFSEVDAELALDRDQPANARRTLAWVCAGAAVAGIGASALVLLSAKSLRDGIGPATSDLDVAERNAVIRKRNYLAGGLMAFGAATAVTAGWLFWTSRDTHLAPALLPDTLGVAWSGRF